MTPVALMLVLAAAVMHAGWNALAKSSRDAFAFLWLSMLLASSLLMPAAIASTASGGIPAGSWPFVGATAALHALYFYTLARAYRAGDLSQVYPIARGLSVALVAVLAWVVLGEQLSAPGMTGIAAVVAGVIVVAQPWQRNRDRAGVGWALATGVIIAGYSVVDKAGVLRAAPLPYVVFMIFGACLLLLPYVIGRRRHILIEWQGNKRAIVVAATLNLTAYILVLYAMRLSAAAYVVASRELSIVASVLIARVLLSEQTRLARLAGATLISLGVTVLALL